MPPLEGKVAIVTGASSGIGEAIAKDLVASGMKVAALARRIDRVEELAKSLHDQKGTLLPIKCDVTSEEDIKKAIAEVEAKLGAPTALINNAGVFKSGSILEMDNDNLKTMLNTNVVGLVLCSREAINLMVKHQIEGTVINVNSVAGHVVHPFPGIVGYSSSKYAGRAISEGTRIELAATEANIRVTNLSPGLVETEMTADFIQSRNITGSYVLLPSDIADCVHFILEAPQRVNIPEMMVTTKPRRQ